ncbi:unnamed protein product [Moneuplotes crassus]|uniref:Transmembrane protein n=1 Tax=Euplotes crassus TaxID=5936 RepID=A0AAD1X515_EUPCR|nr:unnamed protein product [Moneuplotes crassus]
MKTLSFLRKSVKKTDFFPQQVSLTYKGNSSFQTFYGGVVSLAIIIMIISYSIRLLMVMFQRQQTNKTLNTIINDIQNDPPTYEINKDNFGFVFTTQDSITNNRTYDPSYISVSVTQNIDYYDQETGQRTYTSYDRDFDTCGEDFPTIDQKFEDLRDALKDEHQCLDNQTFMIQGSTFSQVRQYITLNVNKCVNGTSSVVCKTTAEINQKVKNSQFVFGFATKFFDFDDYYNPIKSAYDTRFGASLDQGFHKMNEYLIQKSEVFDVNYFFQFGQNVESEFYVVSEEIADFESTDGTDSKLLTLTFIQDAQMVNYERIIFSFFDAFSQIGGVFGLLLQVGALVTNSFSEKYFLASLFSFLYISTQKEKIESKGNNRNAIAPTLRRFETQTDKIKPYHNETLKDFKHEINNSFVQNANNYKNDSSKSVITRCINHLESLRRLYFTSSDYLKTLVPVFSNRAKQQFSEHSLKFSHECDIVEIIHSMRALKLMMKLVLSEHQQLLVSFSSKGYNECSQVLSQNFNKIPTQTPNFIKEAQLRIDTLTCKLQQIEINQVEKDIQTIIGIKPELEEDLKVPNNRLSEEASRVQFIEEEELKEEEYSFRHRNKDLQSQF